MLSPRSNDRRGESIKKNERERTGSFTRKILRKRQENIRERFEGQTKNVSILTKRIKIS